jgi:PAS domain S-box-containing protein
MKINLTLQFCILVAIPLIFEILFVAMLGFFIAQAEQEAEAAFHSAQISNGTNKLVHDMFQMTSISRSELIRSISSEGCETAIAKIRSDLDELRSTVQDNHREEFIVENCADAGEEAYGLIEQLRHKLEAGASLELTDELSPLKNKLRSCVTRMVSKDLLEMGETEKANALKSHATQLHFRKRIKWLLLAGVIFNVLLTLAVTAVISRSILGRLKIMVDNIYRLASSMPLNRLVGGTDEISQLDRTFHQLNYALAESKKREQALIDHSLDVICSIDEHYRFRAVNPACQKMFGFTEKELLGKNLEEVIFSEDWKLFNHTLYDVVQNDTEVEFETRIQRKDGTVTHVLWTVHWVMSERLIFCVVHDITERKEAERMRQEVVAMVSHDLRTPLSTIGSYFEMLSTGMFGELTQRGMQLLKVAESNISRMVNLTNDLLDIEKSKAGMLTVNCTEVALNDLLDKSIKSVTNLASDHEVRLEMKPTSLSVYADANRVTQVLVNLLSNAIKFSPKQGTISIHAEEKAGRATIFVTDQGRGVPDNLKQTIFERFQQVEIADAADKGGSGLGLAICKAIVELHGGQIKVEDNGGQGSIFSFSLALAETKANAGVS